MPWKDDPFYAYPLPLTDSDFNTRALILSELFHSKAITKKQYKRRFKKLVWENEVTHEELAVLVP